MNVCHAAHIAGVTVSYRDLADLQLMQDACVQQALPGLVGWDVTMQPMKSDTNAALVKQVSTVFTEATCAHGSLPY